jgi:hypothetical protein
MNKVRLIHINLLESPKVMNDLEYNKNEIATVVVVSVRCEVCLIQTETLVNLKCYWVKVRAFELNLWSNLSHSN